MNYLLVHCNQPVRFQVRIPADLLSKSESVLWPVADQSAASSPAAPPGIWHATIVDLIDEAVPFANVHQWQRRDVIGSLWRAAGRPISSLGFWFHEAPFCLFLGVRSHSRACEVVWSKAANAAAAVRCVQVPGWIIVLFHSTVLAAVGGDRARASQHAPLPSSALSLMLRQQTLSLCFLTSHFLDFSPQLHPLFLTFFFLSIFLLFCLFSLFVLPASMASLFIPFLALRIHVYLYLLNIFPIVLTVSFWFSLPLFTFLFLVLFSIFLLCPNSSFYLFHHTLGIFDDACFPSFFTFLFLPFFLSTSPKPFFFFPCLLWSSPRSALLSPSSYCTWCSAIRADSSLSFFSSSLSLLPSPLAPSPQSVHSSLSTRCRLGFRQAGSYQATG